MEAALKKRGGAVGGGPGEDKLEGNHSYQILSHRILSNSFKIHQITLSKPVGKLVKPSKTLSKIHQNTSNYTYQMISGQIGKTIVLLEAGRSRRQQPRGGQAGG